MIEEQDESESTGKSKIVLIVGGLLILCSIQLLFSPGPDLNDKARRDEISFLLIGWLIFTGAALIAHKRAGYLSLFLGWAVAEVVTGVRSYQDYRGVWEAVFGLMLPFFLFAPLTALVWTRLDRLEPWFRKSI